MTAARLVARSLRHYWRSHLAAIAGVATAVAVLAGALLVGDSVRGTLRDLATQRLGATDQVVVSGGFFRDALAADIQADASFTAAFDGVAPLIILPAVVTDQESGRRVGDVRIYGVDERFWQFHGADRSGPAHDEALMSLALAGELGTSTGGTVLARVQRPSDIPLESLHGRKEDTGRTIRLTGAGVLGSDELGEFALEQRQSAVRALFVPLSQLQEELDVSGRVNTLLVSGPDAGTASGDALAAVVRLTATLEDIGLNVTTVTGRNIVAVTSDAGVMTNAQATAAAGLSLGTAESQPLLTYLANTLRVGDREIPYSLVTGTDLQSVAPNLGAVEGQPIVLNEWAASELQARVGDPVALEYYVWEDAGRLATRSADFRVAAIVPIAAGDREMAPAYPGITDSPAIVDWDPPFPLDLRRIQRRDEEYWNTYRTTPKAFVDFETGRRLWQSRHGGVTSIRIAPAPGEALDEARTAYESRLRMALDPLAAGLAVRDVRAESVAASRGATDFGAYFVYFSFFLVVSALLLAVLFFRLSVDQRAREIGLLRAVGFGPSAVRRLFVAEGLLVSLAGSILGTAGAVAYATLLVAALRTWWVDAVGTRALTLHVSTASLAAGAAGVVLAALVCIWWTLRGLARLSERELLAGQLVVDSERASSSRSRLYVLVGAGLTVAGGALIAASTADLIAPAGSFFGAGAVLLAAALCFSAALFRRRAADAGTARGVLSVSRLGLRNTTYRPARSVLSIAVIASATFILVAVDAFRRDVSASAGDRSSGTGGYALFVETLVPIAHDPNTDEGRQALNLGSFTGATIEPFRLLPGDDASCLNLYVPTRPRILAASDAFIERGRFTFQDSLAANEADRANPWQLLQLREGDGAIPVIADANSLTYVLHRNVGDSMTIPLGDREITVRFVAALRDSLFQSELIMSQANFVEHFPDQQGYQVFLMDSTEPAADLAARVEDALTEFGGDATPAAERLATFHRVENTYLSTFQTLGGLGLLLGTVGLAAVMLRNVLERRRELAMLGALGFRRRHFMLMSAAETLLLLAGGLGIGALCAAVAIAPTVAERGGRLPISSTGLLVVFAVFLTGLLSSLAATRLMARAPIMQSLRTE
jgi:ABC-type lipoprotein release transport system permease subunit